MPTYRQGQNGIHMFNIRWCWQNYLRLSISDNVCINKDTGLGEYGTRLAYMRTN